MEIRPFTDTDLLRLVDLTIATFGPFYEESFRPSVGEVVFAHQHGGWENDYRGQVPTLHDPDAGKHVAVAANGREIAGYVAWNVDADRRHGEIDIVAVAAGSRREHIGGRLCEHAMAHMKQQGVEVVSLGTGGDSFHAPARALYESLGFTPFVNVLYFKAL